MGITGETKRLVAYHSKSSISRMFAPNYGTGEEGITKPEATLEALLAHYVRRFCMTDQVMNSLFGHLGLMIIG